MDLKENLPYILGGGAILLLLLFASRGSSSGSRVASIGPVPRDNSDTATYAAERTERAGLVANAFSTLASFGLGARSLVTQENLSRIDSEREETLARINADQSKDLAVLQLEGLRRTLAHSSRQDKRKHTREITLAEIAAQTQRESISAQERTQKRKSLLDAITSGLSTIFDWLPIP